MTAADGSDDALQLAPEPAHEWVSVAGLQCRLRELFATRPAHRALATGLQLISELLRADYAVVHACYGAMPLSEEWARDGFEPSDALREAAAEGMATALAGDQATCARLTRGGGEAALVAAVLYDAAHRQAGSAAFLFPACSRSRAYAALVHVESLVGFLAALMSAPGRTGEPAGGAPPRI